MESHHKYILLIAVVTSVFLVLGFLGKPSVEWNGRGSIVDVKKGQCRFMGEGTVCFSTVKLGGFDSGFAPMLINADSGIGSWEISKKIFLRESDFVDKRSWPNGSSLYKGGNWSGSVPDYNVSVVKGTLE